MLPCWITRDFRFVRCLWIWVNSLVETRGARAPKGTQGSPKQPKIAQNSLHLGSPWLLLAALLDPDLPFGSSLDSMELPHGIYFSGHEGIESTYF